MREELLRKSTNLPNIINNNFDFMIIKRFLLKNNLPYRDLVQLSSLFFNSKSYSYSFEYINFIKTILNEKDFINFLELFLKKHRRFPNSNNDMNNNIDPLVAKKILFKILKSNKRDLKALGTIPFDIYLNLNLNQKDKNFGLWKFYLENKLFFQKLIVSSPDLFFSHPSFSSIFEKSTFSNFLNIFEDFFSYFEKNISFLR